MLARDEFSFFAEARASAEGILHDVFRVHLTKALDPLNGRDFLVISNKLSTALAGVSRDAEAAALRNALDALDVDWHRLDGTGINRIIHSARAALNPAPTVVPAVEKVFVAAGATIGPSAKAAATSQFSLDIRPKWSAKDDRITQAIAFSQGNFVRDEYGRRQDAFSLKAKQIVTAGLDKGLDRWDIGKELRTQLTPLGIDRSENYWTLVSGVFVNRARTFASLSAYSEAGITHFVFEAILDKRTSVVCRFMHNRRFEVASAMARAEHVETLEDPEDIKYAQPWLQVGKDDDGNPSIYYKTRAGRTQVGQIVESGLGQIGATGKFSKSASDADLQAAGIATPPLHGHCRSTIVADTEIVVSAPSPERAPAPAPPPVAAPEGRPMPPGLGPRASGAWRALDGIAGTGEAGAEIEMTEALPARALPKPPVGAPPWADALAEARRDFITDPDLAKNPNVASQWLFNSYGRTDAAKFSELKASRRTAPRDLVENEVKKYSAESARKNDHIRVIRHNGNLYIYDDGTGAEHAKVVADKLLRRKDARVRLLDLDQMLGAAPPVAGPAKPLATGDQRVQDFGAKLGDAFKALGAKPKDAKAQEAVRDAVRTYLGDRYGVVSHDVAGKLAGRGAYEVRSDHDRSMARAVAIHKWDGTTVMRQSAHSSAQATAEWLGKESPRYATSRAASGLAEMREAWARTPRSVEVSVDGLRTLIHEEFHGHSPVKPSAYRSYGVGIEEAGTEILARRAMRDMLKIDKADYDKFGKFALPVKNPATGKYENSKQYSYDDYIAALFNGVAKHTGDDKIHERIEKALLATRSDASASYAEPMQAIRAFVNALGLRGDVAGDLISELTGRNSGLK